MWPVARLWHRAQGPRAWQGADGTSVSRKAHGLEISPCETLLALSIWGTQRNRPVGKWPGGVTEKLPPPTTGLHCRGHCLHAPSVVQPLSEEFLLLPKPAPTIYPSPAHRPMRSVCGMSVISWCVYSYVVCLRLRGMSGVSWCVWG